MSINMFDPHSPFDPPQPYLDRYDPDELPGPYFQQSDLAAQAQLAGIDFQHPGREPETFGARKIKAAYYAMIELIDHNVGRLLAEQTHLINRLRSVVEQSAVVFWIGPCARDHACPVVRSHLGFETLNNGVDGFLIQQSFFNQQAFQRQSFYQLLFLARTHD